jgi:hypothetical protein
VLLDIHQGDYDYLLDESPVAITIAPVQRNPDPPAPAQALGTRAVEESRPVPSTGMQKLQSYLHGRDSDTGSGEHEFDIKKYTACRSRNQDQETGESGSRSP